VYSVNVGQTSLDYIDFNLLLYFSCLYNFLKPLAIVKTSVIVLIPDILWLSHYTILQQNGNKLIFQQVKVN